MSDPIIDYFNFGKANIEPIVKRMQQEKAGRIAAAIAQSGNYNDPALGTPGVQDALGAMMLAHKGQLGIKGGELGNTLTSLKILDAIQNPGGGAFKAGPGGMLYNPHTGQVTREPDPKSLMPFTTVAGRGIVDRRTGDLKPFDEDPLKDYDVHDRGTIKMAGDLAVDEARRTKPDMTEDEAQQIRDGGQSQAKKRIYDGRFDPTRKKQQEASSQQHGAEALFKFAQGELKAEQSALDGITRDPADPDSFKRHMEQTARVQKAAAEVELRRKQLREVYGATMPEASAAPAEQPQADVLPPLTGEGAVVPVATRAEAMALPPGTKFKTPDGRTLIR